MPVVITVGTSSSAAATFLVTSAGTISGSVSSAATGAPVTGATLGVYVGSALQASTTSASDGSFSIANLPPGTYSLNIVATGFISASLPSVAVVAGVTSTQNVHLNAPSIQLLSPSSGAVGTIVTISGANFGSAQGSGSAITFHGVAATSTVWSNNSITVPVPTGTAAGSGPVVVTVGGAASNVSTFTVGAGKLTGTITSSASGAVVSGATVKSFQAGVVKGTVTTSAAGVYTLSSMVPGVYDLAISAAGLGTTVVPNVIATAGTTTTTNAVLPSSPGSVSGTITLADGVTAVNAATVTASQFSETAGTGTTSTTGAYTIPSLSPGTYSLSVTKSGLNGQTKNGVAVTSGSASTVNMSMSSPATMTYVYDEASRLVGVVNSSSNAAIYNYDAAGNVVSISQNALTQVSISEFTPNSGPPGSTVTIYGSGFSTTIANDKVKFNNVAATVTSASKTKIVATVPATATTGSISVNVTSPVGNATSSTSFTVTASNGLPTITTFAPPIATPGTVVTITGTNFDSAVSNDGLSVNVTKTFASTATSQNITTSLLGVLSTGHVKVATTAGASAPTAGFLFVPPPGYTASQVGYTGSTTSGNPASVSLATPNQIGLLAIDVAAGDGLWLATSSSFSAGVPYTIYGPYGDILETGTVATGSSFIDTSKHISTAGTCTIVIVPGGLTGSVTMTPTLVTLDVSGPIIIDGPTVASTTVLGQDVRLTFTTTVPNQKVVMYATSVSNPQASLQILKPGGAQVVQTTINSTGYPTNSFFVDTQTLSTPGTYIVLVQHSGSNAGSETIQLKSAADVVGPILIDGSAVTVGPTAVGQDVNLTFTTTVANQRVVLYATAVSNPQAGLQIFNPDGSQHAQTGINNTGYPSNSFFLDVQTLSVIGTYTVNVHHFGTNVGMETLQLKSVPADVTGPIVIDGSAVTVGPTSVGQDVRLTFTTTVPNQRIVGYATAVSNPLAGFQILNPDGSQHVQIGINNAGYPSNSFFMDLQTLATVGTYTVLVSHFGTNVGMETLQLKSVPADIAGSIVIGGSAFSFTTVVGQNANVTFANPQIQTVTIHWAGNYSACAMNVTGPLPSTAQVASPSCVGPTGSVGLPNLGSGTYNILIDPVGTAIGGLTSLTVTSP
jgi:YD repeat-containing protein